jgi:hypothetical protein
VKRWQDGDMCKRWTAAGMHVAEQQFRRIIGYRDLAKLIVAVEHHALLASPKRPERPDVAEHVYRLIVNPRGSPPKFHDDPDILGRPLTAHSHRQHHLRGGVVTRR